jgi:hypothetical protein
MGRHQHACNGMAHQAVSAALQIVHPPVHTISRSAPCDEVSSSGDDSKQARVDMTTLLADADAETSGRDNQRAQDCLVDDDGCALSKSLDHQCKPRCVPAPYASNPRGERRREWRERRGSVEEEKEVSANAAVQVALQVHVEQHVVGRASGHRP